MAVGIAKVHAGDAPSCLGARSIPVDRLAGWLAGKIY